RSHLVLHSFPTRRSSDLPFQRQFFGSREYFALKNPAGTVAAVVVAAGRGLRVGGDLPKQYRAVLGEPVIRPSLATLAGHAGISRSEEHTSELQSRSDLVC